LNFDRAIGHPVVALVGHVDEQTGLQDARNHGDGPVYLIPIVLPVGDELPVQQEVAIVRDNGSSLDLGHPQRGFTAEERLDVQLDGHIGHGSHLDGYAAAPLLTQTDRVLRVIGHHDEVLGAGGHHLELVLYYSHFSCVCFSEFTEVIKSIRNDLET